MDASSPLADQLRTALVANPTGIHVTFIKQNGDKRNMHCTVNPDTLRRVGAIPPQDEAPQARLHESNNPIAPHVVRVWDLEKAGWRSFNLDTVIEFVN